MPARPSAKQPPELFSTITERKWSPYALSSQSHAANVKWICVIERWESWVKTVSSWYYAFPVWLVVCKGRQRGCGSIISFSHKLFTVECLNS